MQFSIVILLVCVATTHIYAQPVTNNPSYVKVQGGFSEPPPSYNLVDQVQSETPKPSSDLLEMDQQQTVKDVVGVVDEADATTPDASPAATTTKAKVTLFF